MQTIARANRVHGEKVSGLIVDYANVFQELEKALAIYAGGKGGEVPVKNKEELIEALRIALAQLDTFCREQDVDLAAVQSDPVGHLFQAVDRLARKDPIKDNYLGQARDIERLYKAIMPDPVIPELAPRCQVVQEVAKALRALKEPVDVTAVIDQIGRKLDESIVSEAGIDPGESATTIDLSQIDFAKLEAKFAKSKTKNSEAVKLRSLIERKLKNLIRFNASRYDYLERFEKMLDSGLPEAYTAELFEQKCGALFQHVLEKYPERNVNVYGSGAA